MYQIVLEDFNAKVGMRQPYERSIGKFSYGNRNVCGHMLIDFCEDLQLRVFNSFFKKRIGRKWMWRSPNGQMKNEIDFIFAPHSSIFIKDVCVVASFNFYSDHRLLRATLDFNPPARKRHLQPDYRHAEPQPRGPTFLNKNIYQFAINQLQDQMPLPTASLDVQYTTIVEHIQEAAQVASKIRPKKKRLSTNTEHLILLHCTMKIDESAQSRIEFIELCKLICKEICRDLCIHHFNLVNKAVQNSRSLRKVQGEVATGKRHLIQLQQDDGTICTTVEDLNKATKAFFEKLYASVADVEFHIHLPEDCCPPFLPEEVHSALMQMKTGKTPGNDHITTEMLKHGHGTLVPVLTQLFNTCLTRQATPKHMANSSTILLFRKGNLLQLKNYRPISLLSIISKLLTKVINNRIKHILDESQPPKLAGFRRHFSTIDHLHSLNKLIEKTHKYQRPLYMLFIDFEKAFDSVEANAIWSAIQEQGVHAKLINLL
uniref:Reverse transcriptase domain-containing protein n=1 Tax=Plectus sambesii TaxID=2011161 RepID=A0A914XFR3_9BILA